MREDLKYLVVGDTIIDENVYLKAAGLSLESPTLKTTYTTKQIHFGGAANVARFLSELDRDVTFLTSISPRFDLKFAKVESFYQGSDNFKTRFWVTHGDSTYKYLQVNDVNDEEKSPIPLIDFDVPSFDVIAFADYRCGLINQAFVDKCTESEAMTYASSQISSRPSNFYRYENVDVIVCNEKESRFVPRTKNICVTRGDKGCNFDGVDYLAHPVDTVVNTIGAGDCFYAAFLATGDPAAANRHAAEYVTTEVYEQSD